MHSALAPPRGPGQLTSMGCDRAEECSPSIPWQVSCIRPRPFQQEAQRGDDREGPEARRTGAPCPGACSAAAEWGPPALRLDFCPLTLWLFLPSLQISMLYLRYKPVHSLHAVQSPPPHSSLQATWLCTHMHTDTYTQTHT